MDFLFAMAAPETQAWWEMLIAMVSTVLFKVAVPVLVCLALALLAKYANVKVSEKQQEKITSLVGQAKNRGEQELKKKLDEGKPPKDKNAERMKSARAFLETALAQSGLTKKLTNKIEDLIESKLGEENKKKA